MLIRSLVVNYAIIGEDGDEDEVEDEVEDEDEDEDGDEVVIKRRPRRQEGNGSSIIDLDDDEGKFIA